MYADDICIMASIAVVLQAMLNLYYGISPTYDTILNFIKVRCMIFKPIQYKLS